VIPLSPKSRAKSKRSEPRPKSFLKLQLRDSSGTTCVQIVFDSMNSQFPHNPIVNCLGN
jgi:hypothetical protein